MSVSSAAESNEVAMGSEQKEVFGEVQAGEALVKDDDTEERLSTDRGEPNDRDMKPSFSGGGVGAV